MFAMAEPQHHTDRSARIAHDCEHPEERSGVGAGAAVGVDARGGGVAVARATTTRAVARRGGAAVVHASDVIASVAKKTEMSERCNIAPAERETTPCLRARRDGGG